MNRIVKRILQTLVAATIVSGTYFGRGKDFPPLYAHKTGDAYGINVAFYTKVDSGASINGINISGVTNNYGQINGLNIGGVTRNYSKINSLSVQLGHTSFAKSSMNGLEIALVNASDLPVFYEHPDECENINGVAVGLVNQHRMLNGIQIGIYNETKDNAGVILNVDYKKQKVKK